MGGGGLQGDVLVAGAALCWGSYTAISIFLLRDCSPLTVAGYTMLFAGLAVLPLTSLDLVRTDWGTVSVGAWAAAAYSALAVAAFGFSAWQRGISRIGANRVLVYQYLVTLTGVISGVLLLGGPGQGAVDWRGHYLLWRTPRPAPVGSVACFDIYDRC